MKTTNENTDVAKAGRQGSPSLGTRECPVCGAEFQPYRDFQRACSRKCREMCKPDPEHLIAVPYTCRRCGAKSVGYSAGGGGKFHYCPDCKPLADRESQERKNAARRLKGAGDERRRDKNRRMQIRKYGIEWERYEQMLADQGGVCAICKQPPSGVGKTGQRLHVDHDHSCCPGTKSCGECIRGLLCNNCNRGIGYLQDDPTILTAALRYVTNA